MKKKKLTLSKKTVSNLQKVDKLQARGGSTYGCASIPTPPSSPMPIFASSLWASCHGMYC